MDREARLKKMADEMLKSKLPKVRDIGGWLMAFVPSVHAADLAEEWVRDEYQGECPLTRLVIQRGHEPMLDLDDMLASDLWGLTLRQVKDSYPELAVEDVL